MTNYILADLLTESESKLSDTIREKASFIKHQERDLPACYPSERIGREEELVILRLELDRLLEARSELDTLILKYS